MSARKVLDSYAVIAFFENESGAERVAELFKQARDRDKPLFMSVINWGEVYYILSRTAGPETAQRALRSLETLPIELVPADKEAARLAAEFKSSRRMSYADCFAAALARMKHADLVTGDREFKEIEDTITIVWL